MAASDTVDWIIKQSRQYPLLTAEQEIYLARQVQEWLNLRDLPNPSKQEQALIRRGKRAYDTFFLSNIRLVVMVANRFNMVQSSMQPEDLVQEGIVGLQRAIVKFDPTRGYKFSTYAFNWIRQSISRSIYDRGRTIRLPSQGAEKIRHARIFMDQYEVQHGKRPTLAEVAAHCKLTENSLKRYLAHSAPMVSLDDQVRSGGDALNSGCTYLDIVADTAAEPTMTDELDNVLDLLETAKTALSAKQQAILHRRYHSDNEADASFSQIARETGTTRQAVQDHHSRALRLMRMHISARLTPHDIQALQSA